MWKPRNRTSLDAAEPAPASGPVEVIAHDPEAGPLRALRNVSLQSSLAQLKANGYYERYAQLIAPNLLAQLLSSLGPGWIPIELALAHYEACDNLMLSADELALLGKQVGDRLQETALISPAKKARDADFDVWSAIPSLYRMWARLNQGGSVQIVRLGPKELLIEMLGFQVHRYNYYRQAQLAVTAASFRAIGARVSSVKIATYRAARDELVMRVSWL